MWPGLQPWMILIRGLKSSLHFWPDVFAPRAQTLSFDARMSDAPGGISIEYAVVILGEPERSVGHGSGRPMISPL
jgi:hypothetical protein